MLYANNIGRAREDCVAAKPNTYLTASVIVKSENSRAGSYGELHDEGRPKTENLKKCRDKLAFWERSLTQTYNYRCCYGLVLRKVGD